MKDLLKDTHSVDACLIVSDPCLNMELGLWAHRAILGRYRRFLERTEADSERIPSVRVKAEPGDEEYLTSSTSLRPFHRYHDDSSPVVTICVKRHSLATLCVLLRYIYTEELELTADRSMHVIHKTLRFLSTGSNFGVQRDEALVDWTPLDSCAVWQRKEVTWQELLVAVDYYGVVKLQALCEDAIIDSFQEDNVVDILFLIGCSFEIIKEAALDFIADHLLELKVEDKDIFKSYKEHPQCHDMWHDVVRRKVRCG